MVGHQERKKRIEKTARDSVILCSQVIVFTVVRYQLDIGKMEVKF